MEMIKQHIDTYLDGWRLGKPERSLSATAPGFYYDDPNTGRIPREDFVAFMESFKNDTAKLSGGVVPQPFLNYTDTVVSEGADIGTVWCWWCVNGTDFQGSAVIKVDHTGVLSERIAYFTHLPGD